jgi:hypothetical protein
VRVLKVFILQYFLVIYVKNNFSRDLQKSQAWRGTKTVENYRKVIPKNSH